ncbi:RHS repeat domain-containing protein [Dysgonomonas capnocytophagoides]|uniref:RHS repeat domain-containing protein n=1 Tax=Dysgonomonas capnocytophagoides TaxID=45254 RepID=UPI003342835D
MLFFTVIQRNSYYPFGMSFREESDLEQGLQSFKYNGKELDKTHGLNQYDYAARYMDPATVRFTSVDPLAEKYYSISPYLYVSNNPIKFIDPTGMWIGEPENLRNNKIVVFQNANKILNESVKKVSTSKSKIFEGSEFRVRGAIKAVGGEVSLGSTVKLKGNIEVGSIEGKLSQTKVTETASLFRGDGALAVGKLISSKVSSKLGVIEGSMDYHSNLGLKTSKGDISALGQIGDKTNLAASSDGKFSLGAKFSIITAKVSVNSNALANYVSGLMNGLSAIIMKTFEQSPND